MEKEKKIVDLAGKYLTFRLAEEVYGLESLKVHEIISIIQITKLPKMEDYIRGVMNLRGSIIPIIDFRLKCGMPSVEDTEETCIIVLEFEENKETITIGVVVDAVCDVKDIENKEIEATPNLGSSANAEFVKGIAKQDSSIIMLVDMEKAFSNQGEI